ncbi:hypothetical protein JXJ21_00010 [candidate division KSB1 bacterium]|nr:hypothetical protein [candidate division KSB1 bacterium]
MIKKAYPIILSLALFWGITILLSGCDTGIETSPNPGILRITLESDPADTSILIVKDTFTVAEDDHFLVTIFQGKAYKDSSYALLYVNQKSYKEEQIVYNVISRENDEYTKYTIFESHLPPQHYTKIRFGITTSSLQLGNFSIPVQAPENASLYVDLSRNFTISDNKMTEIQVQLSPFKSVQRYRDTYHFIPQVEITDVIYH